MSREIETSRSQSLARRGSVALVDQAVVSGTSFAATVLVGRFAGPGELALYSLPVTLAILIASMQESLVTMPYTLQGRALEERARAVYAGSSLILSLAIAGASAIVALAGAMFLMAIRGESAAGTAHLLWIWAAVLPSFLLREFGRRYLFAHLRMRSALVLDGSVAAVQLGVLAWLAASGRLSGLTAAAALGAGCAVAAVAWLVVARRNFAVDRRNIRTAVAQNWAFGRWVLAGRLLSALNSDVLLLWVIAFAVDQEAAGIFAACMTVVLFSNPFILGLSNVVTPQVAAAYADGGTASLRRVVWQATWLAGLPLACMVLIVAMFGDDVLRLLYGARYDGHGSTVTVLALGILASALSIGAANGLWTLKQSGLTFTAGLMGLATTVLAAYLMAVPLGVFGAACGLLAGLATEAVARGVMFGRLVRRSSPSGSTGSGDLISAIASPDLRPSV